jgi:hypothetical protein
MIRLLAWALTALGIGLGVTARVLDLMNGRQLPTSVVDLIVAMSFSIVGGLIASRRPRNPIGWIYLVAVVLIAFGGTNDLATQYAYYAVVTRPGSLPAVDWVLWVAQLGLALGFFGLLTLPLLLFPDGRLLSTRWRPVALAACIAVLGIALTGELAPGPLLSQPPLDVSTKTLNPTSVDAPDALGILALLAAALYVGVLIACVASVFLRFRAAAGPQRQQLKWFAYGAAWIPAVAGVAAVGSVVARPVMDVVGAEFWPLSAAGIPIATAIAILRYRLYDIDVLIRRTIVYAAMTLALGAVFLGSVLVVEAVLHRFTGGSELAVAASTLATYALFQPIRRQVQDAVDRRFYRSRYDAARTLDVFAIRLRDEVDLDAVHRDLIDAVERTVQPAHASVWLRR